MITMSIYIYGTVSMTTAFERVQQVHMMNRDSVPGGHSASHQAKQTRCESTDYICWSLLLQYSAGSQYSLYLCKQCGNERMSWPRHAAHAQAVDHSGCRNKHNWRVEWWVSLGTVVMYGEFNPLWRLYLWHLPVTEIWKGAIRNVDAKMILTAPLAEKLKRPPGHPRITRQCLNIFQRDLRAYNLTLNEAVCLAQNRPLWRLMSMYGATHS